MSNWTVLELLTVALTVLCRACSLLCTLARITCPVWPPTSQKVIATYSAYSCFVNHALFYNYMIMMTPMITYRSKIMSASYRNDTECQVLALFVHHTISDRRPNIPNVISASRQITAEVAIVIQQTSWYTCVPQKNNNHLPDRSRQPTFIEYGQNLYKTILILL